MFVRKIMTLFRAYEQEAGLTVIDVHTLRILEQELSEAAAGLVQATRELTGLMAREIADQRAHAGADQRAREYEAYALKALETGEEAIARQCAEVVASAETERQRHATNLEATRRHIASLRSGIATADARIGEICRETATTILADEKSGASLRAKPSEAGIAGPEPRTADAVLARLRAA